MINNGGLTGPRLHWAASRPQSRRLKIVELQDLSHYGCRYTSAIKRVILNLNNLRLTTHCFACSMLDLCITYRLRPIRGECLT